MLVPGVNLKYFSLFTSPIAKIWFDLIFRYWSRTLPLVDAPNPIIIDLSFGKLLSLLENSD